jgi:hypothetical protein
MLNCVPTEHGTTRIRGGFVRTIPLTWVTGHIPRGIFSGHFSARRSEITVVSADRPASSGGGLIHLLFTDRGNFS